MAAELLAIKLKLYATLTEYLPASAVNHATHVDISATATPNNVLELHKIPIEKAHLVLLNGVYLDSTQRDQPILNEGDTLAIWPPVAGG